MSSKASGLNFTIDELTRLMKEADAKLYHPSTSPAALPTWAARRRAFKEALDLVELLELESDAKVIELETVVEVLREETAELRPLTEKVENLEIGLSQAKAEIAEWERKYTTGEIRPKPLPLLMSGDCL